MRALVVALWLALWLVPSFARADTDWQGLADKLQGGTWLHYELTALHAVREEAPVKLRDLTLAGVRLHGFISTHRVGYLIGLDLAAGATTRTAGFAYDVALLPVGAAVKLGDSQFIGIGAGVGAMGAVGTLDDAVTFPVEAFAELGLGKRLRVLARARASWLAGAPGRRSGSPTFGFADEVEGTLGLRIGHHYHEYNVPSGNGYFAGVSYRELLGAKFVGLVIGYSIDMATPRHGRIGRSDHDDE